MRQISQVFFGLVFILLACKADKRNMMEEFSIPDPRLMDYSTSDININRAITKISAYLVMKERDIDINDFYLDSLYMKSDTIVVMINHFDFYKTWHDMKQEEKRQKQLKARGDTLIEILFLPPSGNWSGRDRTILYLIKKDSIIDILDQ